MDLSWDFLGENDWIGYFKNDDDDTMMAATMMIMMVMMMVMMMMIMMMMTTSMMTMMTMMVMMVMVTMMVIMVMMVFFGGNRVWPTPKCPWRKQESCLPSDNHDQLCGIGLHQQPVVWKSFEHSNPFDLKPTDRWVVVPLHVKNTPAV